MSISLYGIVRKKPQGGETPESDMIEDGGSKKISNDGWRLEFRQDKSPLDGRPINRELMTNGHCRVTVLLRPGPLAHRFRFQDVWRAQDIEFDFEAIVVSGRELPTYQVFLGLALEKHPEYWKGASSDNELLERLVSSIRHALCLLRIGPTDEETIGRVEFVLSRWSRWRTLSNFQTGEIVL